MTLLNSEHEAPMLEQLDKTKPTRPMWQAWAGLILGALGLVQGILAGLRHNDLALIWLVIGTGWLIISGYALLRRAFPNKKS
jgi:uncharacterized membrane protein HdeD (DUF308 family)